MRKLALLLALAAAACTTGGEHRADGGPKLKPAADPSKVIAAELGFNQLAQTKGQWTAFRETMAPGAQMFVPERMLAADWLKGRIDPPVPVRWQPLSVWSSCDGSHAVTRGEWQRPGSTGSFVTVWERQRDDKYKWVLDMSIATEQAVGAGDTVAARVADCKRGAQPVPMEPMPAGSDAHEGSSTDRTLQWTTWNVPGGGRKIMVFVWNGASFDEVLRASAPLPTR